MKIFEDLVFKPYPLAIEFQNEKMFLNEIQEASQAQMLFDNGYGISVLLGSMFYSNGIDTYEVAVLYRGEICYSTSITDSTIPEATAGQISDIMKRIQQLQ